MLFHTKPKTETSVTTAATQPASVNRPKTANNGKIRLGGGCRLPLQGEATKRDRPRRGALTVAE